MITREPIPPLLGVKASIVGTGKTVKLVALVAVPEPFVILISPVVDPDGTVAVI